jgi:Spy/CpxP family protein refolding chaperone
MFLRTKHAFTGLSLGVLTVSGAVVQAQQPQPSTQNQTPRTEAARPFERREGRGFRRGPGPGGNYGPQLLSGLNLTDDQKKQVHAIIEQTFQSRNSEREELRQLGEKRRQGTLSTDDHARARTLHQQMRASMADTETKIAAVLTAEQKAKAEELIKERKANLERFGGRPRGLRGQPGQGNSPPQKPSNP